MNIIFVAIAFSIFLVGSLISNHKLIVKSNVDDKNKVTVEQSVTNNSQQNSNNGNESVAGASTDSGEVNPTPTSSPTPTEKPFPELVTVTPSKPADENTSVAFFLYSNATVLSQTTTSLQLTSSDNTKTITDWYKNKIKEFGLSVTSFVTTNTNDNVLNKLAGAGNGKKVSVEIKKDANESVATITVNFSS